MTPTLDEHLHSPLVLAYTTLMVDEMRNTEKKRYGVADPYALVKTGFKTLINQTVRKALIDNGEITEETEVKVSISGLTMALLKCFNTRRVSTTMMGVTTICEVSNRKRIAPQYVTAYNRISRSLDMAVRDLPLSTAGNPIDLTDVNDAAVDAEKTMRGKSAASATKRKPRAPRKKLSPEEKAAAAEKRAQLAAERKRRREEAAAKKKEEAAAKKKKREEEAAERKRKKAEELAEKKRLREEAAAEKKRLREEAAAEKKRLREEAAIEKKRKLEQTTSDDPVVKETGLEKHQADTFKESLMGDPPLADSVSNVSEQNVGSTTQTGNPTSTPKKRPREDGVGAAAADPDPSPSPAKKPKQSIPSATSTATKDTSGSKPGTGSTADDILNDILNGGDDGDDGFDFDF